MNLVQKGITHLNTRYQILRRKYQEIRIRKQRQISEQIYDAICARVHPSAIKKKFPHIASQEITAILNKLEEIGYLDFIKPLNTAPTISVIIPHYNHHQYLDEALKHLSQQTNIPEEIIIVDDQSKDRKLLTSICKKHESRLPLQLIIPSKKLSVGGCKQHGAELATSNIICMHDADDISHPNRIELTKIFFQQHPNALQCNAGLVRFTSHFFQFLKNFNLTDLEQHLVSSRAISRVMKRKFIQQRFSAPNNYAIRFGSYGAPSNFFWGCSAGHVAYRKEIVHHLTWSTPTQYTFTKYEDYDFNFLLFLAGQKSYQIDLPLIYYRMGSTTNHIT